MPRFVIVAYVRQILGRGAFAPPHPRAAPEKPIVNTSNIEKRCVKFSSGALDELALERKQCNRDSNARFMSKPFAREYMQRIPLQN